MTNKEPRVIIGPEAQEKIDSDPKLAEIIRKFSADARQVMLGVTSGQYKSFDEGMTALGYEGGPIDPDNPPDDMPEDAKAALSKFLENPPEEED